MIVFPSPLRSKQVGSLQREVQTSGGSTPKRPPSDSIPHARGSLEIVIVFKPHAPVITPEC
jgi:hypothetical protein